MPDDTDQVVRLLRTVTLGLQRMGAGFAEVNDLHPTDLRAIVELLDAERDGLAASPGLLADRLALTSASATALADRLERAGYVERRPDPADRRRVRLIVTDRAKQVGLAFFGPLIGRIGRAYAAFTPDERDAISRFLTEISEAIPTP